MGVTGLLKELPGEDVKACTRIMFSKLWGLRQRRPPAAAGTDGDENTHPSVGRRDGEAGARCPAAPVSVNHGAEGGSTARGGKAQGRLRRRCW